MTRIGRSAFLGGALVALAASFPLAASESSGYSVSVLVDGYRVAEYAARNRVYVEAVRLFCDDRVRIDGRRVRIVAPIPDARSLTLDP